MTKRDGELKKLAIKHLNTKNVQKTKKDVCEPFLDKKQIKICMTAFDKSFIKSFIKTRRIRKL